MNAKLEPGRDFGQCGLGALAPGQAVGDEADVVAAVDLSIGEVQDVTEDSADRRAAPCAGYEEVDRKPWA